MKKLFLLVILIVFAFGLVNAEYYIKTRVHTDPFTMMGKTSPAKDEVNEIWFTNNKSVFIKADMKVIVDEKAGKVYMINFKNKTVLETSYPFKLEDVLPEQMKAMMSMMKISVKVNPTGETKVINKWKCSKYDVTMSAMGMNMNMEVWASTNVPFDWKELMRKGQAIYKLTMRMDDNSLREFEKIKGIQISTIMTMNVMGSNMKTTSMVEEISKKTPPADLYSIPSNYKKINKLEFSRGGF